MRNKKLIAGLAALAALALACGSSPEVAADGDSAGAGQKVEKGAAPTTVAMGKPIKVSADGVQATYTASKPKMKTSGEYGITPQNGAWLLVHLRVDVTKGEAFTCACDIQLVEKDGKVNEFGIGGLKGFPDFSATQVRAGQHADGWVVFDLPEESIAGSKVQLKVSSLLSGSAYGYWTVKY